MGRLCVSEQAGGQFPQGGRLRESDQEKGSRHHPLNWGQGKESGHAKTRAKVEQVFGQMALVMGGKVTRCIGLARARAWWCLRNLVFNFLRFTQLQYGVVQA